MAKRKAMISIDFSAFDSYAEQLDKLGADLQEIFTSAMEEVGAEIQEDTINALEKANLPAKGVYSKGTTENQVIRDPKVEWHGTVGEMPLGFDKTKPGAGGFLITGTPKMKPDRALEDIYKKKSYENKVKNKISDRLKEEIDKRMR